MRSASKSCRATNRPTRSSCCAGRRLSSMPSTPATRAVGPARRTSISVRRSRRSPGCAATGRPRSSSPRAGRRSRVRARCRCAGCARSGRCRPRLPSLSIVALGDATLALALSGWTDAGWAGIATFDLLAADDDPRGIAAVVDALATPLTDTALADKLGRPRAEVRRTLLAALAQLRVGHDLATGEFFARPLTKTPVPATALRYRDAREAAAHRLLAEPGAVTLTKVHDQGNDGRSIEGQVVDAKA